MRRKCAWLSLLTVIRNLLVWGRTLFAGCVSNRRPRVWFSVTISGGRIAHGGRGNAVTKGPSPIPSKDFRRWLLGLGELTAKIISQPMILLAMVSLHGFDLIQKIPSIYSGWTVRGCCTTPTDAQFPENEPPLRMLRRTGSL